MCAFKLNSNRLTSYLPVVVVVVVVFIFILFVIFYLGGDVDVSVMERLLEPPSVCGGKPPVSTLPSESLPLGLGGIGATGRGGS